MSRYVMHRDEKQREDMTGQGIAFGGRALVSIHFLRFPKQIHFLSVLHDVIQYTGNGTVFPISHTCSVIYWSLVSPVQDFDIPLFSLFG